jgi:hypothetical protein
MPIEVSEVSTLQQYLEGIMNRAAHHGPDVGAIALTLAGAIRSTCCGTPFEDECSIVSTTPHPSPTLKVSSEVSDAEGSASSFVG